MEIQPEAAVKFKNGKRRLRRFILRSRERCEKKRNEAYGEAESAANGSTQWAHEKNKDGIAKSTEQQILRAVAWVSRHVFRRALQQRD